MNNSIKVSVCIPVYNGESFIGKTIESVLASSFGEFELLVVDNCSTDSTISIVSDYVAKDSRVKLIQNDKNYGMVGNWNICIEQAASEYVLVLCADDLVEVDCIERKYSALVNNPTAVLCTSAVTIIDENDSERMIRKGFAREGLYNGFKVFKKSFRRRNIYGEPSNVMFLKSAMKEIGGFSKECPYSPDWLSWLMLSLKGDVYYIKKPLTRYRVSSINLTNSYLSKKDLLKRDEDMLIELANKASGGKLTFWDIFVHKMSIKFRIFMRKMFFRFMIG